MKFLKKIKEKKGATMTDVVVALMIFMLFTGILTTSYFQIYKNNTDIKQDAEVVGFVVKILENIDRIPYDEVTDDINENINETYEMPDGYNINVTVEKFSDEINTSRKDLIKIVTLRIDYKIGDENKSYGVKKLKIREL